MEQQSAERLACACGKVNLLAKGPAIASVECCCNSCREAGARLASRPGGRTPVDDKGATRYVMQRKDCVQLLDGAGELREFRLNPQSKTRRVVASCCNTPIFVELSGGHWLSLYGNLWPDGTLPPLELRTMCGDLPAGTRLPDDVPNAKTHTLSFYWKLLWAWAAMGFRAPRVDYVKGELDGFR